MNFVSYKEIFIFNLNSNKIIEKKFKFWNLIKHYKKNMQFHLTLLLHNYTIQLYYILYIKYYVII